jgi:hypothetical protein
LGVPDSFDLSEPELMPMQDILEEIRLGIFAGSNPIKPYRPTDKSRKQATKVLSSNQIFLGAFGSPRRNCLLERKWDMQQSLNAAANPALDQTEYAMKQILGRKLPITELRHIPTRLNRELSLVSASRSATRANLILWFHEKWSLVDGMLREMTEMQNHLLEDSSLTSRCF